MSGARANRLAAALALAIAFAAVPVLRAQEKGQTREQAATTSCLACHGDADLFDEERLAIVAAFEKDVHRDAGLSCQDCHGGNASLETAEDLDLAMDPAFADHPYVGAPERAAVPAFCGRCHSDPEYMKRFRPDVRVDQEAEYRTSQHGKALAAGRTNVATCIDCHSVHGILKAEDPESPVYPTRVAETCRSCHADGEHMAGVTLPSGEPLPTDQFARWRRSVHATALLEKGDFSAPTCNDCHGNHGAAPPGIESIAFVCGQCHGREARLFRDSAKHAGYQVHNEYLADAGEEGCASCHEAPEPAAALTAMRSFTECATCHGNHSVIRPTIAMLSPLPETPCAICHEGSSGVAEDVKEPEASARRYAAMKKSLLATAAADGLAGDALFDHLVDRALALPTHTVGGDGAEPRLREEFERLFVKFRIGKTTFTYGGEDGGEVVTDTIVRCSRCHGAGSEGGEAPAGFATSSDYLSRMRELTVLTGRAERIVLKARRGGVETRDALTAIDGAVDSQIALEVLVHGFETGEGSAFAEQQTEGLASARAALTAGQSGLDELAFRRRGLAISLIFILAVAIGLAFKIRELSGAEAAAGD